MSRTPDLDPELQRQPRPEDLPEVQALMADGWEPLEEAPIWWNLPAVWPAEHVTSLPDTLPRFSTCSDGVRTWLEPWTDEVHADIQAHRDEMARRCGLQPLPPRRLWLLRSPWPTIGLDVVLTELLARQIDEAGLEHLDSGAITAVPLLLARTEDEVWDWWAPEPERPARRWRALGRTGRDVAALLLAGLGPDDVQRLAAPLPDGAGLAEPQQPAWCRAVDGHGAEGVDRVIAWRRLGLPENPPRHLMLLREDPADYADWFTAGFSVDDVETLAQVGLGRAVTWREAGFGARETLALIEADLTVTPAEARAFGDAGITGRERTAWLEAGFDVVSATGWRQADVLPNEARLWRAAGLGPADAAGSALVGGDLGEARLPPGYQGGWFAWTGSSDPAGQRAARRYGVQDPPGTRGRLAQEQADDRSRGPGRDYLR